MTNKEEQLTTQNIAKELEARRELRADLQTIKKKSNPLTIVREKEIELKKQLLETQIQADKIIENAKREGEQRKQRILSAGEKKAEQHYNNELEKINEEAQKTRNKAPSEVKAIAEKGLSNIDKSIEVLENILIPNINK